MNIADHVSRSSHLPEPTESELKEEEEYIDQIGAVDICLEDKRS